MTELTQYIFKEAYLPEVSNTGGNLIPKKFVEERESRRQWAIICVIIGLIAQIMQIGVFDLCEYFGDCINS